MTLFIFVVMDFNLEIFAHPAAWISLITLTFLEIVLGVDNIIFISLTANRLPAHRRKTGRNIGLLIALVVRLILLLFLTYIIGLTKPLFHIPVDGLFQQLGLEHPGASADISFKDLILIAGGFFLIAKSTSEIHDKVAGLQEERKTRTGSSFFAVIIQIVLIDIVFSFDSILTAIGLTPHVFIMMFAVVVAIFIMMLFSTAVSNVINKYPTLQMLALSFLILIGFTLILEGLEIHVNKGFIYVAVLFSLTVELLNIRLRKRKHQQKEIKNA